MRARREDLEDISQHNVDGTLKEHTAGVVREEDTTSEDYLRRLKLRKDLEAGLVAAYDKTKITDHKKECWFLVDSNWLNAWSEFVNGEEGPPPGPISSKGLLDEKTAEPLPGLRERVDYRGVVPIVFFMFLNLHGHDGSPHVPRFVVDIYKHAVPVERLVDIQYRAQKEAKIKVNEIRSKWMKWELDDDDDEEEDCCLPMLWCCRLRKEHVEAIIYWMVLCCVRRKSGRDKIKYTSYTPLAMDSIHGGSIHGNDNSTHGSSNHGILPRNGVRSDADGTGPADRDYGRHTWMQSMISILRR